MESPDRQVISGKTQSAALSFRRVSNDSMKISVFILLLLATLCSLAHAALVRPLEGEGDFRAFIDIYDRERADGTVDVILIGTIPNSELQMAQRWGGGWKGQVAVDISLKDATGLVHTRTHTLALQAMRTEDAQSNTVYQNFSFVLRGIDAVYGSVQCTLRDLTAGRTDAALEAASVPTTHVRGEWVRAQALADVRGLYLHPPLFLAGAPLKMLPSDEGNIVPPRRTVLIDHLHPNRRYGLEQSKLQVTFDIERAGHRLTDLDDLPHTLMMQVLARDLDYMRRDTIRVLDDITMFAAAGGHATVTWELDVNSLPPGAYQLSCAPQDGFGNSWVTEFDVLWSAHAIKRTTTEQNLVGHLVLQGKDLAEFKAAGPAEREALLAQFWDRYDPDPSTKINEADIEFRQRMRHVTRELGGLGKTSALDDRGMIYLLLGPPDDIEQQVVPMNADSFDSALDKVYDVWAPMQYGTSGRPLVDADGTTVQATRERNNRGTSQERFKAFELWSYDDRGKSLFPHQYSDARLGMRFLFLARLSGSVYHLETTSAYDQG